MLMLLALLACHPQPPAPVTLEPVQSSPLQAGAAEASLELPIGTPLGCYTSRCSSLGGTGYKDSRHSAYNTSFVESLGIHTRPTIKAIWLKNDQEDLVLLRVDLCMSSDQMVSKVTAMLEEKTGLDLNGKVVMSASHSHGSYGAYQDSWHFLLGTDRFNAEIFERFALQMTDVAFKAFESRQPAAIGTAWAKDWDPEGRVYSDRRGENDDLVIWDDQSDWETGKDPFINSLRIDALDGSPIAFAFTFGMHGIIMSENIPLVTRDAPGGLEEVLQESFDSPVVLMHLQGSGGDASPRGSDTQFARNETIGEYAKDAIMALYESTPTSSDPVRLETASRHLPQSLETIHVSRNNTVDLRYKAFERNRQADELVFDDNGQLIEEIDEFNAQYGAVFCGGEILLPAGFIGTATYPYDSCTRVDLVGDLLAGIFKYDLSEVPRPFPVSTKAGTTVSRFGPIQTRGVNGDVSSEDFFIGFFPGEPTATFGEQWRRRVRADFGYPMALTVGYAQDHEGYLLIPEDWMAGGYEPFINMWGPLQGEYLMEGMLAMSRSIIQTDVYDDPDPTGYWSPTQYTDYPLPTHYGPPGSQLGELRPDPSPNAGTRLAQSPEYYWVPEWFQDGNDGFSADLSSFPAEVQRLDVLQFGWIGGDPMVDPPHVYLERQRDAGGWERVLSHSGRPISEAFSDILVAYTPDPIAPVTADQTHYYWAAWQAVSHVHDRAGLPLGTYRLKVEGQKYTGDEDHWPWTSEPYEMSTESFTVTPATIEVEPASGGLWLWLVAPREGYRLVDLEGQSNQQGGWNGRNPVRGTIRILVDGVEQTVAVDSVQDGRAWVPGDFTGAALTVTDPYGNTGSWSVPD